MKRLGIVAIVVLVVCVLMAAFMAIEVFPLRKSAEYTEVCVHCGIVRVERFDDWSNAAQPQLNKQEFFPTALSKWYADHVEAQCGHEWKWMRTSRETYRGLPGWQLQRVGFEFGGVGGFPSFVYLSDNEKSHLEALVKRDPKPCKGYINQKLVSGF